MSLYSDHELPSRGSGGQGGNPSYASYSAMCTALGANNGDPASNATLGVQGFTKDSNTTWTWFDSGGFGYWMPEPGRLMVHGQGVTEQQLFYDGEQKITLSGLTTSRFTAPIPGRYTFAGGVSFTAGNAAQSTTGTRQAYLRLNGTARTVCYGIAPPLAAAMLVPLRTATLTMVVGNYVELMAYHNSGSVADGPLKTVVTGELAPTLTVCWSGP